VVRHGKRRNILDCHENWQKALSVFRHDSVTDRTALQDRLLSGCRATFFSLVQQVKGFHDQVLEHNRAEKERADAKAKEMA
jgi:hypothetical protein